jgi:hypothetical protein
LTGEREHRYVDEYDFNHHERRGGRPHREQDRRGTMTAHHPLLDHRNLYHVGLFVDDVPAAMAQLGAGRAITWTAIQEYVMLAWLPGAEPAQIVATGAYSVGGPVHVELTHIRSGPLPKATGLDTPHHVGYWCDDVMTTTDQLIADGWSLEFKGGLLDAEPTISVLRAPSGYCVELVPSESRERVERKLSIPAGP